MSGPEYPPIMPGSNAIGEFTIGVSPIGTIPPFNMWSTIIAQYANSQAITSLIGSWVAAIDPTVPVEEFYDLVMNVATAQGYGLDVWGRIVGVNRTLQVETGGPYVGFEETGDPNLTGFNQSPFYAGEGLSNNYSLADPDFRTLIYAKAMTNIWDGSIPGANKILLALFPGQGQCYVTDGLNMTMTYTFGFALSLVEQAIVFQTGALPKPAGVAATVIINP